MAALDGKITIERKLRPCMVYIPAKIKHKQNTSTQPGQYIIEQPKHEVKALFHCWNFRSELVGESYFRGGHPAGQISSTFALVEYEDGTIHEVAPTCVRFVDNAIREYAFPEMENSNV